MSLEKPNWFNGDDRRLYDKLFYQNKDWPNNLTPEEDEFVNTMYCFEQYATYK